MRVEHRDPFAGRNERMLSAVGAFMCALMARAIGEGDGFAGASLQIT